MGYTRRQIHGTVNPSTVGASMQVNSIVMRGKDYDRIFAGTQVWSIPFPLFQSTLVEGVDFPFGWRRTQEAQRLPSMAKWYARHLHFFHAGLPLFAFAAFNEPPSDDPLFFSRIDFTHESNRMKLRKRQARLGLDFAQARGFDAGLIPADDYGVTVDELFEEIQYHTLVAPDGGLTWDVWALDEILGYLQDRLSKWMIDSDVIQKRFTQTVSGSPFNLPADVLRLRRLTWNGARLYPVDTLTADRLYPTWSSQSGVPESFVYEPNRPTEVRLVPAPSTPGTLAGIYVPTPGAMSLTSILPIPNLFTYGVKYGVMAEMFSKQGEANDSDRARYCEARFKESVALARALLGVQ